MATTYQIVIVTCSLAQITLAVAITLVFVGVPVRDWGILSFAPIIGVPYWILKWYRSGEAEQDVH